MGKISYKRTSGGPFAKTADLYGSFELAHLTKVVFISATKQALRRAYLVRCSKTSEHHFGHFGRNIKIAI
jgi:hypothetical protein